MKRLRKVVITISRDCDEEDNFSNFVAEILGHHRQLLLSKLGELPPGFDGLHSAGEQVCGETLLRWQAD